MEASEGEGGERGIESEGRGGEGEGLLSSCVVYVVQSCSGT